MSEGKRDDLRWAVLGTGVIANEMAQALKKSGKRLYAVGNRTYSKAVAFAEKYGVGKIYRDFNEMFTDPEVDAIYITTPHNTHIEFMRKAIRGGKHIFVEKSITLNSAELEEAVKKDDDPFGGFAGGEGLTVSDDDSNAAAFGIKKDDDVFGGGSDDGFGSGFADFGIKKDDDAFAAGDDDSIGSGFADFGIKKDDDAFAGSDDDSIGSGFAE